MKMLGLCAVGFGVYLLVDPSVERVLGEIPTQQRHAISYVLIGTGALMMLVGLLGLLGVYRTSALLLNIVSHHCMSCRHFHLRRLGN